MIVPFLGQSGNGKSYKMKELVHSMKRGLIFFDTMLEVFDKKKHPFVFANTVVCYGVDDFIKNIKRYGFSANYVCQFRKFKEYDLIVEFLSNPKLTYCLVVDEFGTFCSSQKMPDAWRDLTLTHRHGHDNTERVLFLATQSAQYIHRTHITLAEQIYCFHMELAEIEILSTKISLSEEQKRKIEKLPPHKFITLR